MSRNKRKQKYRKITGVVEVFNITKGRRKTTIIDFDNLPIVKNTEISGSIVEKSSIYERNDTKFIQKEEIYPNRPIDEE